MKLHYFPRIYPDELLYSVIARYQKHVGDPPHTLSNFDLLGNGHVIPSLDMQNGIRNLISSISSTTHMSDDRVLDELTLFNYLVAYVDTRLASRVRSAVLAGKVRDWYVRLGYAAFKVNRLTTLRFCMSCRERMLNDYGELYWRRAHQLSSVLVCKEHQQSLYLSKVDIQPISRHSFIAADTDNNPIDALPLISICDERSLRILVEIATMSESLLDLPSQRKTLGGWTSHYRRQLEDAGLVSVKGRISMKRLHDEISLFYHGLANQIAGFKNHTSHSWVSKLARKQRSLTHPMHHLFFQCYLNRLKPNQYKPFGLGPWPCANPLSNHYGNAVIRSFETHTNHGHQVAVFKCKCGYVYTRWFQPHTGQIGAVRFKAFGPTLEPAIRSAIQKEISLRALARELQLDPKTVVRLASNLGVAMSWKTGKYLKKLPQELSAIERTVITDNLSKKAFGKLDWNAIDTDLKNKVKVAVRNIKKKNPPIKVTIAEIERTVKRIGWISKRLMKLPLTTAYLHRTLETHSAYRERRIYWAIDELLAAGKPLVKSNVIRTSGLRSDANPLVAKALAPLLKIRREVDESNLN